MNDAKLGVSLAGAVVKEDFDCSLLTFEIKVIFLKNRRNILDFHQVLS
jgi:hypothetical protein